MHAVASFVFWLTLILYLITLFTVTYVGVYLTYVAIPTLIISGLIMRFSNPKPKHKKVIDDGKQVLREVGRVSHDVLEHTNSFLGDFNTSLGNYNKVNDLVKERTRSFRNKIQSLKLEKVKFDIELRYSESATAKGDLIDKIELINKEIASLQQSIQKIRHACELEVKVK